MAKLTITPGPLTDTSCTFVADAPIHERGEARYTAGVPHDDQPLAAAILAVPGVEAVTFTERSFTVEKAPEVAWDRIEGPLQYAVTSALERPAGPAGVQGGGVIDDDAMYEMAADLFEREINPSVAQHGGRVELIDVQDATVVVRMLGGCQGCGMASVTLRQGIEGSLRRMFPGLQGLVDITDHAAGTNPYFA